jgi:hypothetical protein
VPASDSRQDRLERRGRVPAGRRRRGRPGRGGR